MSTMGWLFAASSVLLVVAGCSNDAQRSHGAITEAGKVSTFDLEPGDCLLTPKNVTAEVATVTAVPCKTPHTQEVYAKVRYEGGDAYPGNQKLTNFADAQCGERYEPYTGIAYGDLKRNPYYYTYLFPSPRGWDTENDREIKCVITTTGQQLTTSLDKNKKG